MSRQKPTFSQRKAEQLAPSQSIVMRQTWSDLLFLHWEFDQNIIQAKIPKGLYVDCYKGKAYLGIVPFLMEKVRPIGLPAIPKLSYFNELNLRTYVHDEAGRPGVWFFSLDCDQYFAVKIARSFFHLPYQHAKIASNKDHRNAARYFSSTRKGSQITQNFHYKPIVNTTKFYPVKEESLEFFLTERYLLYSANRNNEIFSGKVHHQPYQVAQADVLEYSTELFNLEGFQPPDTEPCSQLIAKSVDVHIYPLRAHCSY